MEESIRTRQCRAPMPMPRVTVANGHQEQMKIGEYCFVVATFHSVSEGTLRLLLFRLLNLVLINERNKEKKGKVNPAMTVQTPKVLSKRIPALFMDGLLIAISVRKRTIVIGKITIVGTTLGTSDAASPSRT